MFEFPFPRIFEKTKRNLIINQWCQYVRPISSNQQVKWLLYWNLTNKLMDTLVTQPKRTSVFKLYFNAMRGSSPW